MPEFRQYFNKNEDIKAAIFITWYKSDELAGCIGTFN